MHLYQNKYNFDHTYFNTNGLLDCLFAFEYAFIHILHFSEEDLFFSNNCDEFDKSFDYTNMSVASNNMTQWSDVSEDLYNVIRMLENTA